MNTKEKVAAEGRTLDDRFDVDKVQHETVASAALADALTRDNISSWSKSSLKLFGLIAVTGLGKSMSIRLLSIVAFKRLMIIENNGRYI